MSAARDALFTWILRHAAGIGDDCALVAALAERLRAAGVGCERLWIGYTRPHPLLAGVGASWEEGRGVKQTTLSLASRRFAQPQAGPILDALTRDAPVRQRIADLPRGSHGISTLFWDDGYSEVVFLGFPWEGGGGLLTMATRRPGGFEAGEVELLGSLRDALGVVMHLRDRMAFLDILASTYLGRDTGARVLAGAIHRGDGETIRAAIWFSDLRGFTSLSERLPLPSLLGVLDDAFEAQVAAIEAEGGEVLKFIGDGMLAIFRPGEGSEAAACRRALAAARSLAGRIGEINGGREERGEAAIRYGVALHFGDVLYGNIGAPSRLDFTVIGPAVNLAARLEGVCGQLGVPVVASPAFAVRCPGAVAPAGEFALKGLAEPVAAFLPVEGGGEVEAAG